MTTTQQEEITDKKTPQLHRRALDAGRALQSEQTQFLHYTYHSHPEDRQDGIPLYYNALFALALLRSRVGDNMQEGIQLLQRLLPFQGEQGNFPVYLHEYPTCRDRSLSIEMLPVFYWVEVEFGRLLPASIREQWLSAITHSMEYALSLYTNNEMNLRNTFGVKLACAAQRFGALLNQKNWINHGRSLFDQIAEPLLEEAMCNPEMLAELVIAEQMLDETDAPSFRERLWSILYDQWHAPTATYMGPSIREYQFKQAALPSYFDLLMGELSGHESWRTKAYAPYHLLGALPLPHIPEQKQASSAVIENTYRGRAFHRTAEKHYTLTLLDKQEEGLVGPHYKGFHPLRINWGDSLQGYSFVCHVEKAKVTYQKKGDTLLLQFHLPDLEEEDERPPEGECEVCFFINHGHKVKLFVDDNKATCLELEQPLKIHTPEGELTLTFRQLAGEGCFTRHITKGNRPSQRAHAKGNLQETYDWALPVRTVVRGYGTILQAEIQVGL